jgi:hypothetical protein
VTLTKTTKQVDRGNIFFVMLVFVEESSGASSMEASILGHEMLKSANKSTEDKS